MTAERAQAYGRVLALLRDGGELQETERDQLREAADALLFAHEADTEACGALAEMRALTHALVDSGRWRQDAVGRLLAALRSWGPEGLPAWTTAQPALGLAGHPFWSRTRR